MQSKFKLDPQTQAVAIATGAATIAAVATMFVPAGLWETLTGSTGVSEMVPAMAAPLGDTARALIAFAFGALTLVSLAALLLRKAAAPHPVEADMPAAEPLANVETEGEAEAEPETERISLFARLQARIAAFAEARRGGGDLTRLDDLPKLRAGDAHPDAPPRRPFSANRDLITAGESADALDEIAETPVEAEPVAVETVEAVEIMIDQPETVIEPPVEDVTPVEAIEPRGAEISALDAMVSRFETALAEREAQLAQIESIARELPASNVQPIRPDIAAPLAADPSPAEPAAQLPESSELPETVELDAALRSALETLHRMNARAQ